MPSCSTQPTKSTITTGTFFRGVVAAVCVVAFAVAGVRLGHGQTASRPPAKLTPEQRREANRFVGLFRRARGKPDARAQIVADAIEHGRPAVAATYSAIVREMYPKLKAYRGKFYQQAVAAIRARAGNVNFQEIVTLRQTVLALPAAPNFTKETITRLADPAVQRLKEILVIGRANVLARSEALQAEREKLHETGRLWQQCGVYLYNEMPASDNKPKEPLNFENYLQGEEELAVGMAAPMDARTRSVLVANARLAPRLEPEEARAILSLNLIRNLLGLAPLAIDLRLCAAARDHSKDMRTEKFFAHESPLPGKKTPWDRAKLFGTNGSAENIYHGTHDGRVANQAWFHSPGHHKNMLGNHARVGVGRSGGYFTQMFGR